MTSQNFMLDSDWERLLFEANRQAHKAEAERDRYRAALQDLKWNADLDTSDWFLTIISRNGVSQEDLDE